MNKIIQAEGFEKFLHTKYVGTKRFGLDGAESLIPALEQIIKIGGQKKVKEVKIGMSHRGRLNVLANVLQKSYKRIFNEFAGEIESSSVPDMDKPLRVFPLHHRSSFNSRIFSWARIHVLRLYRMAMAHILETGLELMENSNPEQTLGFVCSLHFSSISVALKVCMWAGIT